MGRTGSVRTHSLLVLPLPLLARKRSANAPIRAAFGWNRGKKDAQIARHRAVTGRRRSWKQKEEWERRIRKTGSDQGEHRPNRGRINHRGPRDMRSRQGREKYRIQDIGGPSRGRKEQTPGGSGALQPAKLLEKRGISRGSVSDGPDGVGPHTFPTCAAATAVGLEEVGQCTNPSSLRVESREEGRSNSPASGCKREEAIVETEGGAENDKFGKPGVTRENIVPIGDEETTEDPETYVPDCLELVVSAQDVHYGKAGSTDAFLIRFNLRANYDLVHLNVEAF
ncbi:hypothetical protein NDU88_001795 [Pleurodeles waltl]|uniref:Uncharacterized protein n=1 Tax=Pleurodeles waltl TaxID=8319 RepID=A0AAV7UX00_PLEWA|nr:hypothetical protein NDU88_001795 [Pleurodeles waltl]